VILFSCLRFGFAYFVIRSATYKTLYGALAALPVFLVWMYLAWAVVIFGAVVTAALEDRRAAASEKIQPRIKRKKKSLKKVLTPEQK
jgi:membrane protein